jgi:hypothetical protein
VRWLGWPPGSYLGAWPIAVPSAHGNFPPRVAQMTNSESLRSQSAPPPLAPFTRAYCTPVRADSTRQAVQWKGARDLSKLAGQPVQSRFTLRNGRLYAFWVSPATTGASHGYVAAGGPGFTGPIDTVGAKA